MCTSPELSLGFGAARLVDGNCYAEQLVHQALQLGSHIRTPPVPVTATLVLVLLST